MQDVLLPVGPAFPATDANDASSLTIASLVGGGYVIARAGGSGSVWVQRFDSNGAEVGAEILVSSGSLATPTNVVVAGLSNGSFVVSWSKTVSAGSFPDSYARIYGADGTPAGAEFVTHGTASNGAQVFALSDGGFAVTWGDNGSAIGAQRFNGAGSAVGSEITVATGGPGNMPISPQGIGLADGGMVVSWSTLASGVTAIRGQLIDAAGQLVGGSFVIAANPGWSADIAALPSGGFVATWTDSNLLVKAQIYDDAAQPVGGQISVSEPGHTGLAWSVAALPGDAFVVGWRDNLGGSTVTQNAQMFNSDGSAVGSDFVITSPFNIGDGQIWLASAGDGRIVALTGQQRLISVPTLGTSGDDTFVGTGDADRYMGLAGNDDISGGAGNDELDGGAGVDEMSGGPGDDIFYVDVAADVVIEAAGEGTDRIITEVSYTLAAGSEIEILDGSLFSAVADLTGNDFGNTLIGNTGNNALHGLGGNDRLLPGGGVDAVYGEAGDDTLVVADSVLVSEIFDGGPDYDTLEVQRSVQFYSATVAGIEEVEFVSTSPAPISASFLFSQVAGVSKFVGTSALNFVALRATPGGGTFTMPDFAFENWTSSPNLLTTPGDRIGLIVGSGTDSYTLNAREGLGSSQYLAGGAGNDTLNGSGAADTLYLSGGADVLNGNGGDDLLVITNNSFPGIVDFGSGSQLNGGGGTDTLLIAGAVNLHAALSGIEQILLEPIFGTDPGLGAVALLAVDSQSLNALAPSLTLMGTGSIIVSVAPGTTFNASGYVHAPGSAVSLAANGGSGNETIIGTGGNDVLLAGTGYDVLVGGGGDDQLHFADFTNADYAGGGTGYDTLLLQGNVGGPLIVGAGQLFGIERIELLAGDDTRFGDTAGNAYSYNLRLVDANVANGTTLTVDFSALRANEHVIFGARDETGGGMFTILGGFGDDTIAGGSSDDTFVFGAGRWGSDDSVDGSGGNNRLSIELEAGTNALAFAGNQITAIRWLDLLSGGAPGAHTVSLPTFVAFVDASSFVDGERLIFSGSAGRVTGGRGDDSITGTAAADYLIGGAGNDVLIAGTDFDTLRGGDGDDIMYLGADLTSGDYVRGDAGYDRVVLQGNYTLPAVLGGLGAEEIVLLSASDASYGNAASATYDYSFAGALAPVINGRSLLAGEDLTLNGSGATAALDVSGGAGNDTIAGGSGADTIRAGGGADSLTGNGGNDLFRFEAVSDSVLLARDWINDLWAGDVIDLSAIDADSAAADNQAFGYIGGAAFSGHAGELRVSHATGSTWLVQGDVDGNGVAEFELLFTVADLDLITSSDFVL